MANNHMIYNSTTKEFRYGSGLVVYSECLRDGRLLCLDYQLTGMPRHPEDRVSSEPGISAFSLCVDGEDLNYGWGLVDFSIAPDSPERASGTLSLKHERKPVDLRIRTFVGDNGFFSREIEITNTGAEFLALATFSPLCGTLFRLHDYVFESLQDYDAPAFRVGYMRDVNWGSEGFFQWQNIPYNTMLEFGSQAGRSGHTHPFAIVNSKMLGGYFVCQLAWSNNWKMRFFNNIHHADNKCAYLKLDFQVSPDAPAPMRMIAPGETVKCPSIHFGLNYRDFDDALNQLRTYQRRYIVAKPPCGHAPVIYNHWGFMRHELSEEKVKSEIDKAAEIGCEVFTVDAGWYGNMRTDWGATTGDWTAGDRLPNDLFGIFQYAREKGLKCGLWMEPEAIGKESKLLKDHPDWPMNRYGKTESRNLDLLRPEIREYLKKQVIRLIDRYQLDFELPKPLRSFLSEIILRFIHLYRLHQGETSELQHVTFLEEVHNLFPKSYGESQANSSLESLFREIRSFGEGLVYITQHPSLTQIYLTGNSNTLIILGLQNEDDVTAAKKALFLQRDERLILTASKSGKA